jgi:mycofactocin precursor
MAATAKEAPMGDPVSAHDDELDDVHESDDDVHEGDDATDLLVEEVSIDGLCGVY